MNKLIKELVPDIRVANDSRELILQCCSEFIRVVTSEANSICEEQQKKTMSAEHVIEALDRLGFSAYRTEAESAASDCKGKRRRQSTRLEHLGIPEEELLRQQQELFARAKAEQQAREQEEWLRMQADAAHMMSTDNGLVREGSLSTSLSSASLLPLDNHAINAEHNGQDDDDDEY